MQRFEVPGVSNYTALLLSPDGGTLYLGARELLVAVNTSHFQPGAPARRVSPWSGDEHPMGTRSPWGWAGGREGGTQPTPVQGVVPPPAVLPWDLCKPQRIRELVGTVWRQLPPPSWAQGAWGSPAGTGRTSMLGEASPASPRGVACGTSQ